MTPQQVRADQFTQELKDLLKKHHAEIELDYDTNMFGHTNTTIRVYMDSIVSEDAKEIVQPFTVFDLGNSIRP